MRYHPHTEADIRAMLDCIGLGSLGDLFRPVPEPLHLTRPLNLPPPLGERDLMRHMEHLAARNQGPRMSSFLGGGVYDHHVPPVVDALIQRSEFTTAYTPYQPEVSQGTLTAMFEFQTLVCQLLGTDVANASMYDGSTATAEAVLMAQRATRRQRVLMARSVHPDYRAVAMTYLQDRVGEVAWAEGVGQVDPKALENQLGPDVAALVVQSPNFLGIIEDLAFLAERAHANGSLLIVAVNEPVSLGLLAAPGDLGADIVAAEALSLAGPVNFGGPGLGLLGCRADLVRQLPGRIVGRTTDNRGQVGYVITLATREQHIRRERATSNICTNEGLVALAATIHLCLLGPAGLGELAHQNLAKAHWAQREWTAVKGVQAPFKGPFFNEMVLSLPEGALEALEREGIVGGLELGMFYPSLQGCALVAVTETTARGVMEQYRDVLAAGPAGQGER